jgi:hypothetical protein
MVIAQINYQRPNVSRRLSEPDLPVFDMRAIARVPLPALPLAAE